ncbi:hypothetical protein CWM47_24080 [Spirosoma pollinicola]|uniref:Uncharacterized protein n=1 Tax=Spirosoma pollinicola TaxID=2057025 RepID=A0A2K8Z431_9BACT|nr:hypothetical protein CWM47_24080 [Spirosoma pollinicola]
MQGVQRKFLVGQVLSFYQRSHSRPFTFFGPTIISLSDDLMDLEIKCRDEYLPTGVTELNAATQFFSIKEKPSFLGLVEVNTTPLKEGMSEAQSVNFSQ